MHMIVLDVRFHKTPYCSWCVTWLIHVCAMICSHVWHDSFIRCYLTCVTWLIHMCDDAFTCVPWLIHTILIECAWHDSFICVLQHVHMCAMTHPYDSHWMCAFTRPLLFLAREWKEINTNKKRPTHMNRDEHIYKETNTHQKRPTHIKRDQYKKYQETQIFKKRWTH